MRPAKRKYSITAYKCPKCGSSCVYDKINDVYACNRPLILTTGEMAGSCGKFDIKGKEVNLWKRCTK